VRTALKAVPGFCGVLAGALDARRGRIGRGNLQGKAKMERARVESSNKVRALDGVLDALRESPQPGEEEIAAGWV